MKILITSTNGGFLRFFRYFIPELYFDGNTIDVAVNENISKVPNHFDGMSINVFQIPWVRSPFKIDNVKAIIKLLDIIKSNDYDIVHCNTPIAAFCTRIACIKYRKKGLKVIYTAHGFHFYKGAPLKNWLLFFPMEWLCSWVTDVIITINNEDYNFASKHLHPKEVRYVPGAGIDVDYYANTTINKEQKRIELGIPKDAFVVLSVGELNDNKNHREVIEYLNNLNDSKIHYVIAGTGPLKDELERLATNCNLHLLGGRNDCNELYKMADLYVLPSKREGLNVSLMEAKASGVKLKASKIRGNIDVLDEKDVYRFDYKNINQILKGIYYGLI